MVSSKATNVKQYLAELPEERRVVVKAGKKLDCGKSCVRFKKLEDLPLDVIGDAIRIATPDEFIQYYEESRKNVRK